jgi:thiamine-phosphate pyrophosphorylase
VAESESLCARRDPVELAADAIAAGVRMIQLRFKSLPTGDLALLAAELLEVCTPTDTLLLINDDLDAALACGAHGVHLGAADTAVAEARLRGSGLIIGATARTPEEARAAAAAGADTLGSGSVFASATKPGLLLIGTNGLTAVVQSITLPVTAIGGIDASNCREVMQAGAAGFSAIQPFIGNADPAAVVNSLVGSSR